jgi:hypothetical protein
VKVIWVIAGTVLAGLLLGFWATRKLDLDSPSPALLQPAGQPLTTATAPDKTGAPLLSEVASARPNPRLRKMRPVPTETNWEDQVREILSADDDNEAKAKEMLGLFPSLPPEGQVEVVEQLGVLLPDKDYGPLAQLATNSALPEPVLAALLGGLVTRPNSIRLPVLLSIAQDEQHPESEDARDLLTVLLGETYGTNWQQMNARTGQATNGVEEGESQPMSQPAQDQ